MIIIIIFFYRWNRCIHDNNVYNLHVGTLFRANTYNSCVSNTYIIYTYGESSFIITLLNIVYMVKLCINQTHSDTKRGFRTMVAVVAGFASRVIFPLATSKLRWCDNHSHVCCITRALVTWTGTPVRGGIETSFQNSVSAWQTVVRKIITTIHWLCVFDTVVIVITFTSIKKVVCRLVCNYILYVYNGEKYDKLKTKIINT